MYEIRKTEGTEAPAAEELVGQATNLIFREVTKQGENVGEIFAENDYLVATLLRSVDGRAHGQIRLSYEDGRLTSNFRKPDGAWGGDVSARKVDVLTGSWRYGEGKTYQVRNNNGMLVFYERTKDEGERAGELISDFDGWHVASLITPQGTPHGQIRIRFNQYDGKVVSNFRKREDMEWKGDVYATPKRGQQEA